MSCLKFERIIVHTTVKNKSFIDILNCNGIYAVEEIDDVYRALAQTDNKLG